MATRRGLPLLAAGLAALAYLNALDNPFVYDDRATVLENPSLVDLRNWRFVLVYSLFRPLVNVSYALDRALWGFQPFGFHLTNVALHVVNVWLFFHVVRDAVGDSHARLGRPPAERVAACAAFVASALWAVHPVMTEAVGYVSGRSEVLCATFFLTAWRFVRRSVVDRRPARAAAGVAAFLAALASREVAVAFPFVFLTYDWLCLPGTREDRRRRAWRLHAPLVGLVLIAATVRLAALVVAERPVGDSPWHTLLTQTTVTLRYVRLLVLPVGQSLVHPVRQITHASDPVFVAAALVLLGAVAGAWFVRARAPLVSLGVVWFILLLAPSSSAVALRESMAEHRVYLASAGVFLLAGAIHPRASASSSAGWRMGFVLALAVLLGLTIQRNRVWADPVRLWAEAARHAPAYWEAHYALGDAWRERGRPADAAEAYRAVIRLRPGHRDAWNNLGICLAELGDHPGARDAFERALAIDPGFARAETNLGTLAVLERDPVRARAHFERALALDPRNIPARRQLAALLETAFDDPAGAARLCREILALAPQTPGAAECVTRNEARLQPSGRR